MRPGGSPWAWWGRQEPRYIKICRLAPERQLLAGRQFGWDSLGGIHGFELQLELVGYEGNEFGIGGLALGVADGVAEKTLQGVQIAPVPGTEINFQITRTMLY